MKSNALSSSPQNKNLLLQLLWSSLAGFVFGILAFIVASLFLQKIPADLKILEYTAPIAAFLSGVFLWQLLVSRSKEITLWKGMWAGALISLIAHLFAWYFAMFYSSVSGERMLKDLTFFQYLWVGLINALTGIIIVGWLTVPGGILIGYILASLQGRVWGKGFDYKKIIRNNRKTLMVLIAIGLFSVTCLHTDGPYKGKVVELETGKPIEGAVVAAEWTITVFAHIELICDAKETLTDRNGEFELSKGVCINHPLASMSQAFVTIFKPGYLGYPPLGGNEETRKSYMPDWGNPRLFESKRQYNVVRLGKPKTLEERKSTLNDAEFILHDEVLKKLPNLIKLTNEENKRFFGWERKIN